MAELREIHRGQWRKRLIHWLVPRLAEMDWMPIESAPKDERWVLVARGDQMGVAWYNGAIQRWSLGPLICFDNPTHWMPLPPPPQ